MNLTEAVKSEAKQLGFGLVGVTTPDPPRHFEVFESWLERGAHGEMKYLATQRSLDRRRDPQAILEGCESILVLGMRYPAPAPLSRPHPSPSHSGEGVIAAYAWGEDYHEVLPGRMKELVRFIEEQVGAPVAHKVYTDTGPLLERELAQRAGLGWIGKNTCLINPQEGSYFLLAEILLDLRLDPDLKFEFDRCGSCRRCLDACPMQCILPDRTLDAQRCISYLTIELKGVIPVELRSQMGNWVFGCDVCQQVCPWNQRHEARQNWNPAVDPALQARPGVTAPDLASELSLTPEGFNRKFKSSPVKRAKRRGYLRNVAAALGNSGRGPASGQEDASANALVNCLEEEPEALVRAHAAWALGRIGGEGARKALEQALERGDEADVVREIREALKKLK